MANSEKKCDIDIFGILDYDDYHHRVVDLVSDIFDQSQIPYKLLYLPTAPLPGIDNDPTKLLVVIMPEFTIDVDLSFDRINVMFDQWKDFPNPVLIITAVDHADLDYNVPSRVTFMHMGGDFLFQMLEYPVLQPQASKNLDAEQFWVSLNQEPRSHNSIAACYLLGNDLGRIVGPPTGLLKISNHIVKGHASWDDFYQQCKYKTHISDQQHRVLQKGFSLFNEGIHFESQNNQLNLQRTDYATNFDQDLRQFYVNSLVEIVNETVFFTQGIHVTAKFLNSVYGFNLPIILSSPGTVQYLRDSGFDMCDDVIDHSYDAITDHVQRMFAAIDLNKKLLSDKTHAQKAWLHCVHRLQHNHQHAKHSMYTHFITELKQNLTEYALTIR